jgi:N-acyl-D-amino-acid deacylase
MTELVFRGALLVDGSGGAAWQADVAVDAGLAIEIAAAGTLPRGRRRTVDAAGLALAPGFIDMHSHADFTLPAYPGAVNSLSQGVTSEVVGICGWSPAPLAQEPGKRRAFQALAGGSGA